MSRNAFSLVELSIVLVIIGLVVGGLMVGSSMIRGAEVKSVMAEYAEYKQAAITFRNKYAALPGDLTDASSYWASASNGNGNSVLDWGAGAGLVGEAPQFWSQLALAGLIEGQFTGLEGPLGAGHIVIGTNAPKSALANGGWGAWHLGIYGGDASNYNYNYGNVLTFGGNTGIATWNYISVLTPEEAWNIDLKIDDGMPGAGKIVAYNITTCTTAASNVDYAASYRLDNKNKVCGFYFINTFNE